jgi:hypothetical protein
MRNPADNHPINPMVMLIILLVVGFFGSMYLAGLGLAKTLLFVPRRLLKVAK